MAISISGALRDNLLDTGSLYESVNGMLIYIFAGTVPANADASATGNTLLCTISTSGLGTGLQFETSASNGVLPKSASAVWSGTCSATGTATFYRLAAITDTHGVDLTKLRVQGTVGLAGADLNVTTTTFTSAEEKRIDYYVLGMLTS
jgi:hypothetical protein